MSCGEDVSVVDESGTTHIHEVTILPLQDGRLPWILSELCVSFDMMVSLDAAQQTLGMTGSTGGIIAWSWVEDGTTAAHIASTTTTLPRCKPSQLSLLQKRNKTS